ncbi:hypothetical protein FJR70_19735 [Bacillus tropicus]|nr:hypothetical protein FJR70_19735 [Bacillus tropicus]
MARSESLDIGTPDREALFASSEGVKWPTDSSHWSWIPIKKRKWLAQNVRWMELLTLRRSLPLGKKQSRRTF